MKPTTTLIAAGLLLGAEAFAVGPTMVSKVLVTGAGGKTGKLVFKKLLENPQFEPVGLARTEKSANALKKSLGDLANKANIVLGDIMDPASLTKCMQGVDSVVLCTSATPNIQYGSLAGVLFLNPIRKIFGKEPLRPKFTFPNGIPEEVDYVGAKNQIDAAKKAGVKKFVFLSSMGGTQPENFLNTLGKDEEGKGGDILLWKRKAEKHLIASGLDYTIIHPGGLLDKPEGQREIIAGINDDLLYRKVRSIPRGDVASVCVAALTTPAAKNRSIDIISLPEGEGTITSDFSSVFSKVKGSCDYTIKDRVPMPAS